ncbi:MAG: WbuC family cupin fold metalloprotein [Fluviicoccus sp.]|uniref:WbuC family cupin fold metalloprotein n=1 Tax=Fluviicoccus sp. TaxID=2003552 RepID=UPI00271567DC|nr:WbuC family cupin fold metalloprotein [Fluviicoccus sp.]MDO8331186.1 WbuC family cupin fold metalloprotein [Fluviicoccus sp.]
MKILDDTLLETLIATAGGLPRLRTHHNLHQELSDPVQRLVVSVAPGTYIQPHRHPAPKWEMILALRGTLTLVFFDTAGTIQQRLTLAAGGPVTAVEIPPGSLHTLFPGADSAAFLEMKPGPYAPSGPEDFAEWAPSEGDAAVAAFQDWLKTAAPGDHFKH